MKLFRWGANRNSGATKVFDKKPVAGFNRGDNLFSMKATRQKTPNGEFDFQLEMDFDDLAVLFAAISKNAASDPAVADALQPMARDLARISAAAHGLAVRP